MANAEFLWNKILFVPQLDDQVRFRNGKVNWRVSVIGRGTNWKQNNEMQSFIKVSRYTNRLGFITKIVWTKSGEYKHMRVVERP